MSIEGIDRSLAIAATAAEAPRKRRRIAVGDAVRGVLRTAVPPLMILAAVIVAWYAITYLALTPNKRFLLPAPDQVVTTGFLDPINFGRILEGLITTATVAVASIPMGAIFHVDPAGMEGPASARTDVVTHRHRSP